MKNRVIKLIVCIAIVSSLMVGFCTSFASAEPAWLIRAKAGIAAAMLASQLVINPVNYALDDALAEGIDPVGYVQSISETPWELYLEQSVIKVLPDVVTIDGVSYSDIWLGPEAAESLRLAGLDFASAYNILSNQSSAVSYADGWGYISGIPAYSVSGVIRTPQIDFNIPQDVTEYGEDYVYRVKANGQLWDYQWSYSWSDPYNWSNLARYTNGPFSLYYSLNSSTASNYIRNYSYNGGWHTSQGRSNFSYNPFSFDYTSGVIDAPIDPEDGLLLRVPTTYSDPESPSTVIYDIHDLVNIYPSVTQPGGHEIEIDPTLNPDFQTDIDLGNGIGDIIRTILNILDLLDNIDIEFAPEPQSPEPGPVDPDPAVPDTPVGEQDGTWLDELLRWIKQAIDTISQSVIDAKDAIINELQDLSQTIQSIPEQILEDIETGPSKVFRKALDVLKSLFLPLLLPIKAMMGLWHYVVEWIASINAPFLWIFGVMSGTSGNMVLPIYAVLAGSICIAIYKALGR